MSNLFIDILTINFDDTNKHLIVILYFENSLEWHSILISKGIIDFIKSQFKEKIVEIIIMSISNFNNHSDADISSIMYVEYKWSYCTEKSCQYLRL